MLKKFFIVFGVVLIGAGVFVFDTIRDAGAFREIEPHFSGTCSVVEGVVGAEDITVDPATGLAYISAHDRRGWTEDRSLGGTIHLYRPGSLSLPLAMQHDLEGTLFPHGISLWKNPDGPDRLFVVNHPSTVVEGRTEILSEVVVFDVMDGALQHVRTVQPDLPYGLNDVVAIDRDHFYATIDRGSLTPSGRMLEAYGRLARGGIAYGYTAGIRKIEGDLIFPNGIQISPDGNRVYVAETTGERFLTYQRDPATNALSLMSTREIDSGLDNLEWDADGNLWIGAHPRAIDFPAHGKDASARSPSQVLRVSLEDGISVEEIYLNDGNPLSGASVGAPYIGGFLIGAVFEPFILDCEMP